MPSKKKVVKGEVVCPNCRKQEKECECGRPNVVTKEVLQKLQQAFLMGCTDDEACLYAEISARTLYYYQEKNESFLQKKALWKKAPILLARKTVVNYLEKMPRLAYQYLKDKLPEEFAAEKIDLTSKGEKILQLPENLLPKNYGSQHSYAGSSGGSETEDS